MEQDFEYTRKRLELQHEFMMAGLRLLAFMGSASAAIPAKQAEEHQDIYVAIGTKEDIKKLLD